jgi:uncharacterized protein (DUF2252 family)
MSGTIHVASAIARVGPVCTASGARPSSIGLPFARVWTGLPMTAAPELPDISLTLSGAHPGTPAERAARGRAARTATPRSSHATFEPAPDRADPVALLERQAQERVPELVPIRYGRMLASPFTFYRGAALIMAADLAGTPRSGFDVQCCGDAHLSNFGLFASPERRLLFDINDFDETLPGPWEWDVKRLATSMLIAARNSGFAVRDQERVVLATVGEYRRRMATYSEMQTLDLWYTRFEIEPLLREISARVGSRMRKRLHKRVAKARGRDNVQAFARFTHEVDGNARIISDPPLIVPAREFLEYAEFVELESRLHRFFVAYAETLLHDRRALIEQLHLVDVARKVVGVGSVGTHAWIALLLGRDEHDPVVLQIKEAQASVLEDYAGRSQYANAGERVVAGQRMMQAVSDIFLGWLHVDQGVDGAPHDYYVRQLRDWKGTIVVEAMDARALAVYGGLCAATLARAHARTGDRIAISAYLGRSDTFDRAIVGFAGAYAEQNERDYQAVRAAVDSGQIEASALV